MNIKFILKCALMVIIMSSCSAQKKVIYMQDAETEKRESIKDAHKTLIRNGDCVAIVVNSSTPELSEPFNLPMTVPQTTSLKPQVYQTTLGYFVDSDGYIDFPILGAIQAEGLTCTQLAEKVKRLIITENLINDPVVIVNILNFDISVLGEVGRPGNFSINKESVTVLQAIAMAGDLTILAKRNDVMVIREVNGQRVIYRIDLRSKDIFNSPAYYLQQGDVVYVEPNKARTRQSRNSIESSLRTYTYLLTSMLSLATAVVLLTQ